VGRQADSIHGWQRVLPWTFRHYGGEFRHSSPRVVNLLGSRIFALEIDCAFIFFLTADAVVG
jgi:hypothetical protein